MVHLTTRTLGEICDEVGGVIRTGPFGSQLHESDYQDEGVPVVMPKNIVDGKISLYDIARIGDQDVARLSQHKLHKGDIIYGRRGDIGRRALVTEREEGLLCGTGSLRISLGDSILNPAFLFYYLGQPQITAWISNQAIGATMPNLNTNIMRSIPVTYPPLPIQHKIASILSSYDDLIENDTRRIKILEEMAWAIYREWFVHFHFPGHEKVKLVDCPLGKIPEGWEVKQIGDVIETLGGGTPSTKKPEYWENGDVIWFTPSDLTKSATMFVSDSDKKITAFGLRESSARMFPPYSVMMTSRATIGVIAINTKAACTNQGFITCIPNEQVSLYQIYFWIQENLEKIESVASGATYKEISRTEFREFSILVAGQELSRDFLKIVDPVGKQIQNLTSRISTLRSARDLLLPKLISGEIEVSAVEVAA